MIQAQHLLRATAARSLTRGATRFATTAAARPTKAAAAAVKPPAARAATTVAAKSAPAKAAAAPAASAPTAAEPAGVESAAPSLYDADSVPGENWSASFSGMSAQPFEPRIAEILLQPINEEDVEIKPDGLIYLPEIKYRRILNTAFGPGGWGLAPRSETNVGTKIVSREWALICLGRFVATARGEQEYFDPNGVATASEGAKSNALMRCCKDLGIAHELWSPRFIRDFKKRMCVEVFCENASTGRKKKMWRRKDQPPFEYPNKESK